MASTGTAPVESYKPSSSSRPERNTHGRGRIAGLIAGIGAFLLERRYHRADQRLVKSLKVSEEKWRREGLLKR